MINIQNFQVGTPKTAEQLKLRNQHNVMFLYAEDGTEWYSCQGGFAVDTIKIAYDGKGIIRSIAANNDVSTLWPEGLSVAEVPNTTANRRATIDGGWVFDGKTIERRVYTPQEIQAQAKAEQSFRIAAAAKVMAPLQDAVDLGIANELEQEQLNAWKTYRVMLNRIDTSQETDITWPEEPK
jgi:hypothetical protein